MQLTNEELATWVRPRNAEGNRAGRERLTQEERVRLGELWIPKATKDKLDAYCARKAITLSDAVTAAIEAYVAVSLETGYPLQPIQTDAPPIHSVEPEDSSRPTGAQNPVLVSLPASWAELARRGHQLLSSGKTVTEIAIFFNDHGLTPHKISRVPGLKPREDSAATWTTKALIQLLRDYPGR